jgi:hypothetical protein
MAMISNDTDNFVVYSKHEGRFTVTKALFQGCWDTQELYRKEMEFQTFLSKRGLAPKILKRDIVAEHKGRSFLMWISEDAGLPIERTDIKAANDLIDEMWDAGVKIAEYVHKGMFVKGFDGKVRVTDFKHSEWVLAENIQESNRLYLQWKDF